MSSRREKIVIPSVIGGLLFLILDSPTVYSLTNYVFKPIGIPTLDNDMHPTIAGRYIHAIVFTLFAIFLTFFSLKYARVQKKD